jgi:hypothetical protein
MSESVRGGRRTDACVQCARSDSGGRGGSARARGVAVPRRVVVSLALVPMLRVDVHVANVEGVVQPRGLGAEAVALELERQARLAAGELAEGGDAHLARRLRSEGDGQLAIRVWEDLTGGRLDREDGVVESERVLLDAPALDAHVVAREERRLLVELE